MDDDDIGAKLHGRDHSPSKLDSTTGLNEYVVVKKEVFKIDVVSIGVHENEYYLLLARAGASTNIRTEVAVTQISTYMNIVLLRVETGGSVGGSRWSWGWHRSLRCFCCCR